MCVRVRVWVSEVEEEEEKRVPFFFISGSPQVNSVRSACSSLVDKVD